MNKRFIILVIVLIILVAVLITMGIFYFLGKSKVKIVEIKTFSEISEFSFQYPVFKGWEVKEIKKTSEGTYETYHIIFNDPTGRLTFMAPTAIIERNNVLVNRFISNQSIVNIPFPEENQIKNRNGVLYAVGERNGVNALELYPDNFGVRISIYGLPEVGPKMFFDKVIETFKLNPKANNLTYVNLTGWFPLTGDGVDSLGEYQNAINAVIDMLKNKNENPSDYYAQASLDAEANSGIIKVSIFLKEFFVKRSDVVVAGDPTAKGRIIYYNSFLKRIIREERPQ